MNTPSETHNNISIRELIKECNITGDWSVVENADVSNVTNMCDLFKSTNFNGDISKWNVSNVRTMASMLKDSSFNGDISKWNISNVRTIDSMFEGSSFNGDISKWDTFNVCYDLKKKIAKMISSLENLRKTRPNRIKKNWKKVREGKK